MKIRRVLGCALVTPVVVVLLGALVGAVVQRWQERRIENEFGAPGTLVPVGDYSLHLWCRGSGSPTILIDPGGYGGTALYAADLVGALEQTTRVCALDPPGQGWSEAGSDPGAIPERFRAFAAVITNAAIDGPLILVGASSGAHVARLFTAAHPSRVRGLVLVDPAFDDPERERQHWSTAQRKRAERLRKMAAIVPALSQVGLHRFLLSSRVDEATKSFPEELQPLVREQMLSRKSVAVLVDRGLHRESGLAEVRDARLPRRLPLVVLTAGIGDPTNPSPYEAEKLAYHRELADLSERGRHEVVEGASHAVIRDNPRRVAQAVETVMGL